MAEVWASSYPCLTREVMLNSCRSSLPEAMYGSAARGSTYSCLSISSWVKSACEAPEAGSTETAFRPPGKVSSRTRSPVTSVTELIWGRPAEFAATEAGAGAALAPEEVGAEVAMRTPAASTAAERYRLCIGTFPGGKEMDTRCGSRLGPR